MIKYPQKFGKVRDNFNNDCYLDKSNKNLKSDNDKEIFISWKSALK